MKSKTLKLLGCATILWLVSAPIPASADEGCDLLDLACTVDDVTSDPGGVVDDPGGTVDDVTEAVDDVLGPADDPAEPIVDPVVDPILDTIDDVLGGGGLIEPPPGGGNGGNGSHDGVPGDPRGGRRGVDAGPSGPTALQREAFAPATVAIGSAADGERPVAADTPDHSGGFAAEVARGLLLVLVLFGVSLAFVTIQDRIDRNDPKLAIAPLTPSVVTFE